MQFLAQKTALVTGGWRGIGAAIVPRLGAAGARVAADYTAALETAKALVAEIAASGGSAFPVPVTRNTPTGRLGRPEDIVGAVMMPVGEDAGRVTGQIIEASGGLQL